MELTRRQLLGTGATLAATATAAAAAAALPEQAGAAAATACQALPPASPAAVAMHRLSNGLSARDLADFNALGGTPDERYERWVDQQLSPGAIDDSACDARLAAARLKIRYGTTNPVNEVRPLSLLAADQATLWQRASGSMMDWAERIRAHDEVRVATWIRAVHSRRQLLEVLVDFWHNHFNVKATADGAIAAMWPLYDRLIRANALGNFRAFVEEVGKSVAMMYYLDNASNRAAGGEGGNENYARELFELHTLGSDNYLKFYDNRGRIETITVGGQPYPVGYIDDDVYEAARCLTGWTVADGRDGRPSTGGFYFQGDWHDTAPKTVLAPRPMEGLPPAPNIPARQTDLKDGKDVFDLVCFHPGTARHLCTKLVRRLVADDPPKAVVDAAVEVWLANRAAPDQLAKVIRAILLAPECRSTFGTKVRRPLDAFWAYIRATGGQLPVDEAAPGGDPNRGGYWGGLLWQADQTGHRLFGWDTPTGHPDMASFWANTNGMLTRWNGFSSLSESWGGNVQIDIVGQTNMSSSCQEIVDFWIRRCCAFDVQPGVRAGLTQFLAAGGNVAAPPRPVAGAPDWGDPKAVEERVRATVLLLAMSPDFNLR
jgi:uncharacterized protein (DUF1800 family)